MKQQLLLLTLFVAVSGGTLLAQPAEFTARDQGNGSESLFMQAAVSFDGTPADVNNDWVAAFDPGLINAGAGQFVQFNGNANMFSIPVYENDGNTANADEGIDCSGNCEPFYLIAYRAADQKYFIYPVADVNNGVSGTTQFAYTSADDTRIDGFGFNNAYDFNTTREFVFPALPIVLFYFNVETQEDVVSLKWAPATETNNDYFTLERSADGRRYEAIGTVAGAGTTERLTEYAYADAAPLYGTSYYRIKQTDYDGSYTYTPVRSLTRERTNIGLTPNPVTDVATVQLPALDREELITLTVCNTLGQPVYTRTYESAGGAQELDLSTLPAGSYHLDVRARSFRATQSLFKQ